MRLSMAQQQGGLVRVVSPAPPPPPPPPAPPPVPTLEAILAGVLAEGRKYFGMPYVWGGHAPSTSFDCSGFVSWCYRQAADIFLTAYTDRAYDETVWTPNPRPGDVIFYRYYDPEQPYTAYPHMGMYLSPGRTMESRWPAGVGEYDTLQKGTAEIRRVRSLL